MAVGYIPPTHSPPHDGKYNVTDELKDLILKLGIMLCRMVGDDNFDTSNESDVLKLMGGIGELAKIVNNGQYNDSQKELLNGLRKIYIKELKDE